MKISDKLKYISISALIVCSLATIVVLSRAPKFLSASEDGTTTEIVDVSSEEVSEELSSEDTESSSEDTESSSEDTESSSEETESSSEETESSNEPTSEEETEPIMLYEVAPINDGPITYDVLNTSDMEELLQGVSSDSLWNDGVYQGTQDVILNIRGAIECSDGILTGVSGVNLTINFTQSAEISNLTVNNWGTLSYVKKGYGSELALDRNSIAISNIEKLVLDVDGLSATDYVIENIPALDIKCPDLRANFIIKQNNCIVNFTGDLGTILDSYFTVEAENVSFNCSDIDTTTGVPLLSVKNDDVVDACANVTLANCTIRSSETLLDLKGVSTLDANSCTFVTSNDSSDCIKLQGVTGNIVNVEDTSFTGYKYAIGAENGAFNNHTADVVINNCDFIDCKYAISIQSSSVKSIITANCDFINNTTLTDSVAINYAQSNAYSYQISDCTIDNYDKALYLKNSSSKEYGPSTYVTTITDVTVTNALYGLDCETGGAWLNMSDCSFSARDNASTGVYLGNQHGNYNYNTSGTTLEELCSGFNRIKNLTIDGFDTGLVIYTNNFYVSDCTITNAKTGFNNLHADGVAANLTISARQVTESDSLGVNMSDNFALINSTIKGFTTGITNSNQSKCLIAGCDIDAVEVGAVLYYCSIYGSKIKTGKIGIDADSNTIMANLKIVGPGKEVTDSFGVDPASSACLYDYERGAYESNASIDNVSNNLLSKLIDYIEPKHTGMNEISGFYMGAGPDGYSHFTVFADTKIYDCEYGVKSGSCYIDDNVEIYNCNIGLDCSNGSSGSLYMQSLGQWGALKMDTAVPIKIHDCTVGMIPGSYVSLCSNKLSNGDSYNSFDIYDCTDGVLSSKYSYFSSGKLTVHDCTNGVTWHGTSFYSYLTAYDNEEYNLIVAPGSSLMPMNNGNDMFRLMSDGNRHANIYVDGQGNLDLNNKFAIGTSAVYLTKDSYIDLYANSFEGTLIFDVPDYKEGRKLADLPHCSEGWKFINANKVLVKKPGWVVTTQTDDSGSEHYLYLTPGAEVTFDYKTNGGIGISADVDTDNNPLPVYEKIAYEEGESVDLSYVAEKPDYEFVGWNTDKDAKTAITSLTAGTENVTLYAIYRKTRDVIYHTYDGTYKEETAIFFNNDKQASVALGIYKGGTEYTFAGYALDKDTVIESDTELLQEGSIVSLTEDINEVYCVYKQVGVLKYLHLGQEHDADTDHKYLVASKALTPVFKYRVKQAPTMQGFDFDGWVSTDGKIYQPNDNFRTLKNSDILTAKFSKRLCKTLEVMPETALTNLNGTIQLVATVLPADAYNTDVEWYSENNAIAVVDVNGKVTGVAEGTVKIFARTVDSSELTDYCVVTVKDTRMATVEGNLTTNQETPIANANVEVVNDTFATNVLTDEAGYFEVNNVPVGEYECIVKLDTKLLAQCTVRVATPHTKEEDAIAVGNLAENVAVDYHIVLDNFVIDVNMYQDNTPDDETTEEITTTEAETTEELTAEEGTTEEVATTEEVTTTEEDTTAGEEETTEEDTTEEDTTEEDGPTPVPPTGDDSNTSVAIILVLLSAIGAIFIAFIGTKET